MKYFFLILSIALLISCQKDNKAPSVQGDWNIIRQDHVTWGSNGDSLYTTYPDDSIVDWVIDADNVIDYTYSTTHTRDFYTSNDTIFIAWGSGHREFRLLEVSALTLKLEMSWDTYFPGRKIQFERM